MKLWSGRSNYYWWCQKVFVGFVLTMVKEHTVIEFEEKDLSQCPNVLTCWSTLAEKKLFFSIYSILYLCLCMFACVTTVIGFPAGTVVKVADVTVLWAAPWMNKDPHNPKSLWLMTPWAAKSFFPACVPQGKQPLLWELCGTQNTL